jgi:hypothetical protein
MCTDATLQDIKGIVKYFENYGNEGFAFSLTTAEEIALQGCAVIIYT